MIIGKQVSVTGGTTELLVDEADFDGPFEVQVRSGIAYIGGSDVSEANGFRIDESTTGVVRFRAEDSVYATMPTGSLTTVFVLAYSV